MITTTFNSGNYNNWDILISETIPAKNNILRQVAIPAIDNTLTSMLGANSNIEKTKVDTFQKFDRDGLIAVSYMLTYTCSDFIAPDAPLEAIEKDTNAIMEAIKVDGLTLVNCNIDINTGELSITYEALFRGV